MKVPDWHGKGGDSAFVFGEGEPMIGVCINVLVASVEDLRGLRDWIEEVERQHGEEQARRSASGVGSTSER